GLAFRKMAVAHDALLARLGLEIGVLCEKLSNLRFDGLGQQRTRAAAQDLCEGIGKDPWLGELDDVTVRHGVSLLHWRSGGVEHHHDTPPYPVTPSPTSGHSCMLVHEILSRPMRDRIAGARAAGLNAPPAESGAQRREQGLARAGNARVRRGMIQLAWRFLMFQKESALALWYRARTADSRSGTRKTMIVALARKLIIALWRFVATGEPLEGVVLRPGS